MISRIRVTPLPSSGKKTSRVKGVNCLPYRRFLAPPRSINTPQHVTLQCAVTCLEYQLDAVISDRDYTRVIAPRTGNQFARSPRRVRVQSQRDLTRVSPPECQPAAAAADIRESGVENETRKSYKSIHDGGGGGTRFLPLFIPSCRPQLVTHLIIGFVENRAPRRILPPLFSPLTLRSPRRNHTASSRSRRERERQRDTIPSLLFLLILSSLSLSLPHSCLLYTS